MRPYQETYIKNITRVMELNTPDAQIPRDASVFWREREKKREEIGRLMEENTALLRRELMPVLDDILSFPRQEIDELETFALALMPLPRQLDVMLNYTIHSALVAYARHWNDRDMLIRELYQTGMALFYFQSMIDMAEGDRYNWRMRMLFGEAASYIKVYDEIEDPQIRGYIHRSMANLALGHADSSDPESGRRKMETLRRSFQILTDPVFREKTPSLPWDVYLYKSHQERTTGMTLLRAGVTDQRILQEVMESAEYVWRRQLEASRRKGTQPSIRWHVVYETAQYHCGVTTLGYLLRKMEELYLERDVSDFSDEGIYTNIFLPALYANYLARDESYKIRKKEVMGHMYRMMMRYVSSIPGSRVSMTMIRNLMDTFHTFIEYPDGISQKEFLIRLVVSRNPEMFVAFQMAASLARMLMERVLDKSPELMLGVRGYKTLGELAAAREELCGYAYECGMFHDVGLLNFFGLIGQSGRAWLKEEKDVYKSHVKIGYAILSRCESTRPYAASALGHHRYYDGQGGYPREYDRTRQPDQPVIDLVSVVHYLNQLVESPVNYSRRPLPLSEALEQVKSQAGTRLSPQMTELLCDMEPQLREYYERGKKEAYREALRYLKGEEDLTNA